MLQQQRKKRRKKQPRTPNVREIEAEQRHKEALPNLKAALAAYQLSLEGRLPLPCPVPDAAIAGSEQRLDLISLAGLKAVLKPKFRFDEGGQQEAVDLFGRVVENSSDGEVLGTAYDTQVLVPGRCRFLISDMSGFGQLQPGAGEAGFDCILLDPPWENKSAKRSSQYTMLPSRQLLRLPIPNLLNKAGGLVALWMTNRERHHRFVEQELLPGFGLERRATWYWLKVTDQGELVAPLEVAHRRPYEVLLLAAPPQWLPKSPLPDSHCIIAVPGQHSRKPQLGRLLSPYLPDNPKCLELFARELAWGWTSAGNEALAFQSMHFFERRPVVL